MMSADAFSRRACPPRKQHGIGRYHGGQARWLHNGVLLASLTVLSLAVLWWIDPAELNLPLCAFHTWTGLDCPACGVIRATHEMLHGRLLTAWHYNGLWVFTWPLTVYVGISELRLSQGRRPLPGDLPRRAWFWLAVIGVAVVFGVARNL
jgi:hypothetical protein